MKAFYIAVVLIISTTAIYLFPLLLKVKGASVTVPVAEYFPTDFAYDSNLFLKGISQSQSKSEEKSSSIKGVIIPHHLTATSLITQGIKIFSNDQSIKTVFILSPNHTNIGSCDIISSPVNWDTPYGIAETDIEILSQLVDTGLACRDDENLRVEHGIAGILPYIKYFNSQVKIIPLALKNDITIEKLDQLATTISKIPNSFLISSIDFSHNLSPEEAKARDKITISLIDNNDFSKIKNLSSEYTDSPSSLITILLFSQKNSLKPSLLDHQDASSLNKQDSKMTTSYLLYSFRLLSSSSKWSLIATGDVMLGRTVNTQSLKRNNFTWAFSQVSNLLKSADITLINLESPIVGGCKPTDKGMVFCAPPQHLDGLNFAGVDVANIANNHIYNYGQQGADSTILFLKSKNIQPSGLGNIANKKINDTTVAFIGYETINKTTPEEIKKQIHELKKTNTLVVISFHWGSEYQSTPNNSQISLAHFAIDSGADVVIGHHPHWVQTEETYKGKPIFYSLGNLIFDQMWSEETKKGMIVRLNFDGDMLINIDHFPVKIIDYGQPQLASTVTSP